MDNKQNLKIEDINIEDEYQELSEIDHVLERPGRDLGNVHYENVSYNLYKPSINKMDYINEVPYNAGLIKLFDEIISNSIDVYIKKDGLFNLSRINVTVSTTGLISVEDDCGIPVVMHKKAKMYLPQLIFGQLRTGSNYNKNKDRKGAGLNGLGSKLTNIFSSKFQVITSDGKNEFVGDWSRNMKDFKCDVKPTKKHGTKTTFQIELFRFGIDKLDLSTIRIIQKRCIDAAACNPGLVVDFKSDFRDGILDSEWKFESFQEYINMYLNDDDIKISHAYSSGKDEVIILPRNLGYNFGFVNGSICSDGTHMLKIYKQISKKVLEILASKKIELITQQDVFNHISVFCKTEILNPDYDSQAKDKLTNKLSSASLYLSPKFLAELENSELIVQLEDYYNVKYVQEQKKKTRKVNRELAKVKSEKTIKCSGRGDNNELWIFEGDSAQGGFRHGRDPIYQAAFLLRGKVLNTLERDHEKIMSNREFFELAAVLKLQFNEPRKNLKNCPFKRIVITTDMDVDGNHISGLLFVFFVTFFPELVEAGMIYRALSPIIVASKGKKEKLFFTLAEYHKSDDAGELKGWKILYKKGLGGLKTSHYDDMLKNPKLEQYFINDSCVDTINTWFNKHVEDRKFILANESNYRVDYLD